MGKMGLGIWCLTSLSTIIFHLYHAVQIYWWRKPEYPEKIADLSQITDKLDHIKGKMKLPFIDNDLLYRKAL
jgi:hypothetical protein